MVRISYDKLPNGNYKTNLIPYQSMLIYGIIYVDSLTFEIRCIKDDLAKVSILFNSEPNETIKQTKMRLREEFIEMGVVFKDEIRKKV